MQVTVGLGRMAALAFLNLESGYLWPLATGGCLAATVVIAWLYSPQVRGGGVGGFLLLALRWVALVALALTLLKPVLFETGESSTGGGVEVLLDCSKSMGVVDTGRTVPQQVALAAALGRLPPGVRPDVGAGITQQARQVENLAQAVINSQSDLDYARVVGRGMGDRQTALHAAVQRYANAARDLSNHADSAPVGSDLRAALTDLSNVPDADRRRAWTDLVARLAKVRDLIAKSQAAADQQLYETDAAVRKACDTLAKMSRLQLAEDALIGPGGIGPNLAANGSLSVFAIDQDLRPVTLGKRSGGLAGVARLQAVGKGSNLTSAVSAAASSANERGTRAIVVFSDGRQTGGRADVVSAMRPSGVPVFTIAMAAPTVSDAWISSVTLPSSAFLG